MLVHEPGSDEGSAVMQIAYWRHTDGMIATIPAHLGFSLVTKCKIALAQFFSAHVEGGKFHTHISTGPN